MVVYLTKTTDTEKNNNKTSNKTTTVSIMSQVYLVTGANSGLGWDTVRRLALLPDTAKVYMGCRSSAKAQVAMKTLQQHNVDGAKLAYVHFDASQSRDEIATIVRDLAEPLNGIVLNAGGFGHDKTRKPVGPNQVLDIHQINLIGHIQLVEILKAESLAPGCKIVFSGSEAARGIPMMNIPNPKMGDTTEWFEKHLKGDFRGARDPMKIYAETKGFAALYFAEWARRNPDYPVWVVSPGGTAGTAAMTAGAVPAHFKVMLPVMMPLMKAMGVMHPLEDGTDRYVRVLTESHTFGSGAFVASKRGTTGEIVDQTSLRKGKKYGDRTKQRVAFEVLSNYATA